MRKFDLTKHFDRHINVIQTAALVITIGFSMHQVNKNTRALEQQEYGALIQQQQEIFSMQIENSETYVKSLLEPEKLSASELWKVSGIIYLRLELLERFQRAHDNGIIPLGDLTDEYSDANIYLGTPVGRLVWEMAREDYEGDAKFVNTIEQNLSRKDAVVPDDVFFRSLRKNYKSKFGSKSEHSRKETDSDT